MIAAQPLQLVVFEGNPPSLGSVAARILQRGVANAFLCVLRPGEDSEPVKRAWMFSVQPLGQELCLFIIHEPANRTFEGIAEFAKELWFVRQAELDLLFLSEDASWRGSRQLERSLRALQRQLDKEAPNTIVRRI